MSIKAQKPAKTVKQKKKIPFVETVDTIRLRPSVTIKVVPAKRPKKAKSEVFVPKSGKKQTKKGSVAPKKPVAVGKKKAPKKAPTSKRRR